MAKIAYADPPYIGQAAKHYGHDPRCGEVDHEDLILSLRQYDAWALSCSTPSLHKIVPMLDGTERFAAWVKPFCSFKPGVNPAYAWEPVIYVPLKIGREKSTVRDWHSANITLRKGLSGAKPPSFCFWLFDLLGAGHDDEFVDLFPGTGVVGRCWGNRPGMDSGSLQMVSDLLAD